MDSASPSSIGFHTPTTGMLKPSGEDSQHLDEPIQGSQDSDGCTNDLNVYLLCGHKRTLFDPKTRSCLLCLLVAAEREVTALKAELDTAHGRLAELEKDLVWERDSYHTVSVEFGRAKERIASLKATVACREDALEDAAQSQKETMKAHRLKCRSLEDQIALLEADKDYALQLLKDTQNESERLRSALDSEDQRAHAALEELRSKVAYLENDHAALSAEREALRERCSLLDSHLATMTVQYESASVSVINLQCQLEETVQKFREDIIEKDADISYLAQSLHGQTGQADTGRMHRLASAPTMFPSAALGVPNVPLPVLDTVSHLRLVGFPEDPTPRYPSWEYHDLRDISLDGGSHEDSLRRGLVIDSSSAELISPSARQSCSDSEPYNTAVRVSPPEIEVLLREDVSLPLDEASGSVDAIDDTITSSASLAGPSLSLSDPSSILVRIASSADSSSLRTTGTPRYFEGLDVPIAASSSPGPSAPESMGEPAFPPVGDNKTRRRHSLVLDLVALRVYLRVMMCAWWVEVRRYFSCVTTMHPTGPILGLYITMSTLTPLQAAALTLIFDARTWKCLQDKQHDKPIARADVSIDGERLALANPLSGFGIYSLKSGDLVRAFGHEVGHKRATPVKFIESGKAIVGGTTVGEVNIWDIETGRKVQTIMHADSDHRLILSLDARYDCNERQYLIATASCEELPYTVFLWVKKELNVSPSSRMRNAETMGSSQSGLILTLCLTSVLVFIGWSLSAFDNTYTGVFTPQSVELTIRRTA
ncbi:hypothetical protein L227DRAFT_609435 [Lentinus tigrinus ALCF2SS1-6]|uniref:Uncharacterized protein n=1 Tax=Lentinus tigrinus ALCF2SS1-6 TaxID=1328759 RepID=A0A5C2SFV6_9APHY|nr:hypothetical protein L227DRAFT_609435 [Lentinus tigrinus ALCF2SS1-6]